MAAVPLVSIVPPLNQPMVTKFADVAAWDANKRAQSTPTPESRLTDALMRMIRTVSITAAPPAHIRPTVWSDSVDLSATVTVPAAVQAQYVAAVSFKVPPGRGARIEQYGVNVLDEAYTYDGSILWAFRLNGSRYLDMGMSNWGEQRGSMVFPRKTVITLDEGDYIQFLVKRAVVALSEQDVQMGFRGWIWRKRNNSEGTQTSVTAY